MTAVVLRADARRLPLPDGCVDLIVTSPPYFGLRSYVDTVKCYECIQMEYNGRDPEQAWPDYAAHVREVHQRHYDGQIGSEATPAEWVANLLDATREWVRVLKPSGSIFVNLGDKYAGSGGDGNSGLLTPKFKGNTDAAPPSRGKRWNHPPKSLLGLPWRYALACMDELGLILRRDIVWSKPNGLPESVTDRCRSSHEYVFHLVRQPRYYAAVDEIREGYAPGTAKRYAAGYNDRAIDGQRLGIGTKLGGDTYGENPLGKLPGSVWSIPSQPLTVPAHLGVDHFAAFPLELPRRIIAGWSPPGICTACGEGRRPVGTLPARTQEQLGAAVKDAREALSLTRAQLAERAGCGSNNVWDYEVGGHIPRGAAWDALAAALHLDVSREEFTGERRYDTALGPGSGKWFDSRPGGQGAARSAPMASRASRITAITGYACACPLPDAPTTPAIVLDPFAGTGTTMPAASALGRTGIGCDLSMDYARLARWRCSDRGEIAKAMQVPKPPPVPDGQEALFT